MKADDFERLGFNPSLGSDGDASIHTDNGNRYSILLQPIGGVTRGIEPLSRCHRPESTLWYATVEALGIEPKSTVVLVRI